MGIGSLAHYSIRTRDVEATRRFYVEVLGLRVGFRPPFNFPGLWLYQGDDETGFGVVHVIGVDPDGRDGLTAYLGHRGEALCGSGALDHIAFLADGWEETRRRCETLGIDYVERTVPSLFLHQVFITDPSGVVVELNYPAAEGGTTPGLAARL